VDMKTIYVIVRGMKETCHMGNIVENVDFTFHMQNALHNVSFMDETEANDACAQMNKNLGGGFSVVSLPINLRRDNHVIKTVNVIRTIRGKPKIVTSFFDNEEGKKATENLFGSIVMEHSWDNVKVLSALRKGVYTYPPTGPYDLEDYLYLMHSINSDANDENSFQASSREKNSFQASSREKNGQVNTINVVKAVFGEVKNLTSFLDNEDGKKEAEALFLRLGHERLMDSQKVNALLDDGIGLYLLHSNDVEPK
jgi:hypothetical protein